MDHKKAILVLSLFTFLATEAGALVVYTENSDTQFNAGTHNSTYVSGAGLGLDYYGHAAGLSAPGSEEWFNPSWKYRQLLTVNSANPSVLSNYSVAVTLNTKDIIDAGRMNADGSDIRFTTAAASGSAPSLSYYIESGLYTPATKIWVELPSIKPGANDLFVYYGSTAAAAASSMAGTFTMGDNFNAANGSAPSSATWTNIQSGAPAAGSLSDIQTGRLRLLFGSPLGTRYYGLRSAAQYSLGAGRRYHIDLTARTTGSDSWSYITLCPTFYSFSDGQSAWLRFGLKHSAAGATYTLERKDYGTKTTLASGSVAAGPHGIDFMISASSFSALLDGSQVYAAANDLTFTNPYIYLEAASASSSLDEFLFDNASVQPYSLPDPAYASAGTAQGRRYPSGNFVSQIFDSGAPGTRYLGVDWTAVIPSSASLSLETRASDTDVLLSSFTAVAKGGDPAVSGRYVQYRLSLATLDPRYTAALSSVTVSYGSPPLAPSGAVGTTLSETSIKWNWNDNSSGQYQEDGFRVMDATGVIKGSLAAGSTFWIETALTPNTQYSRLIAGYNASGAGAGSAVSKYTLPTAPNVSCDKSTGTWLSGSVNCSNLAGFGPNGVAYYRYTWTTGQTWVWSGSETQWASGAMPPYTAPTSGIYFLHVKSYNGDNASLSGYQTYGPFWYDKLAPAVTGFSPSSSPWTNTFVNPAVTMTDTGDSKLYRARFRWTTSSDRPATGWQAYNYTISGDSGTISYTQAGAGQWYLHVEADDVAGNTGYSYAGPFKIDLTNPTGGVVINDGDTYTASRNVTLSLTYADAESGVKNLAYKNFGDPSYSNTELPQATTAWALLAGNGVRQVYVQITDNAGNVKQYIDTIDLEPATSILGSAVGSPSSGVMGEPANTFTPAAALAWTPAGTLPGTPLSGKTVYFHFNGSTKTAVTDVLGEASSSFSVPAASGSYIYNVSFSTDGVYAASVSTGMLTASQRSSTIITEDVNATSNNPFIAKATLKDFYTSTLITGATVNFYFEGSTLTAVTNAIGVATVTFTAPIPVGFYDYTAAFDGDAVYAAKDSVSRIGVGLRVTSLAVSPVSSLAKSVFNAQATLLDGVTPVQGSTVSFFFQGSTNTAFTDASGVAVATFTAPSSSGTYSYAASFPGDGTYAASSGNASLAVGRRPLNLAGEAGQGYVDASFQARAVLYDGITAQPVPGKAIVFVFESSSATVVTSAGGVSTTVFNSGSLPRSSTCYYYFSGDSGYAFADSSGTVSIDRRPVSLAASDVPALLNSSFTATAQLKDTAFSPTGIPGKTLTFSFGGSIQTAITDSLGVASVTYQTGLSTGSYDYYVNFAQDGVYVAGSDTGTVTLDKRPATLSAYPTYVPALNSVKLVADLKDGITGGYISSMTVIFNYTGIPQSTTTGASSVVAGRANAVYPSTGVAGTYAFFADFPGDSVYSAASSTSSVVVSSRTVNLSAFPQTAVLGTTFTVTAELRDATTNALLDGKLTRIAFSTSSLASSLVTNSVTAGGVATSTFSTPSSTGTFSWFANFQGDAAYSPAVSTGTVTVTRRSPTLTAISAPKYVWDNIFLDANFTDAATPLSGKQLTFAFNGSSNTGATDASGNATSLIFSSVSLPGSYSFTVSFAGDANYSAQTSSTAFTFNARPSTLSLGSISAIANSTVTLSATLTDTNNGTRLMSGKPVNFTLQGASYTVTAVTNASGVAQAVYISSTSTGTYTYSAAFAGNTNYTGTSGNNALTVTLRPTVLEMADYSPPNNSTFTVTAVLKDFASGATLSSKSVSFLFMNSTKTVTTALGSASTTYITLNSTTSYPVAASFAGDTLYAPAYILKAVYPGKRNTSILTSDLNTAVALDPFSVTAKLSDYDLGTFLAGSTITFTFKSSTGTLSTKTAFTNSTGAASVQFTAPVSTGNYTYSASFPGDSLYNGTLNTSSILVNRRTPVIEPSDLTGVPASSTFTATALLRDGAVLLQARTLTFVFYSTKTALTSGVGVGSTTFPAPLSTGTYNYMASFGGDSLYNSATAYASVAVVLKPTVLEVLDVADAVVGLKFIATAKLRDIEMGNALVLSTKTIRIVFTTGTINAVTIGGVSTASFTAPPSTGTYGYTAEFFGDSVYGASSSTGTVTVNRRPVLFGLATDPTQPTAFFANAAQSSFTITATLSDGQVAGLNLSTKTVRFVFQGVEQTAVTNSLGIATVTYASPSSSGTYAYYGYFDGDTSYNPNNPDDSIRSVTIQQRPTTIWPQDSVNGYLYVGWNLTLDPFNTQGTIFDNLSGKGISGLPVSFVLLDRTRIGISNSQGVVTSSETFPGILNYGVYTSTLTFAGNQTFAPSFLPGGLTPDRTTAKVPMNRRPAWFDMAQEQTTYPAQNTVISANLVDWYNAGYNNYLAGTPFRYRISSVPMPTAPVWGAWSYGVTTAVNLATATIMSPAAAGEYAIDYAFDNTNTFYFHDQYPNRTNASNNTRYLKVGRRITTIISAQPFNFGAQQPISFKVQLYDTSAPGQPVDGKDVTVVLIDTQTLVTGTGGGMGWVNANFAGLDVGTYTYTATFNTDAAYLGYVSTGSVIISKNNTLLVANSVANVPAGNKFIATAQLQLVIGTYTVAGINKPVDFVFTSTGGAVGLTALTNSLGIATVTFTSPPDPNNYNYTAAFAGDVANNQSSDVSNSVQVVKRRTLVEALPASVYILENFKSSATLTDLDDPTLSTIPAKTISFVVHALPDVNASAVTNAIGLATATIASPGTSGTIQYSATFPGDYLYAVNSDTKTLTISKRVTVLDIVDLTTPTMSGMTLSATLRDITFNLGVSTPLNNVQVKFVFNGVTQYANTGPDGKAYSPFTAPSTANDYPYTATFAGNATYDTTNNTRTVTVRKTNTIITGTDINAPSGAQFTAQALLIDEFGKKLNGFPVNFIFTGTTTYNASGTTDANGTTTALFTAPLSTGIYIYNSAFPGDATYAASSINSNVSVLKASSTLSVPDGMIVVNKIYYATATLKGMASGVGVPDKQISFSFSGTPNGLLGSAATDINGVAIYPFTPTSTGTFRLDAAFGGDTSFYATSASGTVIVSRRVSGIKIDQPINSEVFANFITTATLIDYTAVPSSGIAGRTVNFTFNGANPQSAVTNNLGVATVTYTSPSPSQYYPVTASFAGDPIFTSTNTAGTVNVAKRVTSITVDSGSITALEVFNATATLKWGTVPVVGKIVWFTYKGSPIAGSATNTSGQSFLQFNAGPASGPWEVDGAFTDAADPDYAVASGTNTITVLRRACLVKPDNISMSVFDTFTATATFMDVANSSTPAGKQAKISFNWMVANTTFTTAGSDSLGKVFISSGAPASSGTYRVEGFYAGDTTYLPSLTSTATVTVSRRPTQLSVDDASSVIDRVFTATATLRNNGTLLNGKNVLFTFEGKSFNAPTGVKGTGVAVATFTVTISTGPNQIDAVFNGDASYDASNGATATVTAAMLPTFITPQAATAVANKQFISSATLYDTYGSTVPGKTLSFLFDGFTISSVTNSMGLSTAAFMANVATGTYSMPVSFAGNYKYVASSTTLSLTVLRRTTGMTSGGAVTVNALDVFYATATLKDLDSINLQSKPLRFVFQNSTFTKVTDGGGVSVTTFTAPAASGAYSLNVYFDDGDPLYSPSGLVIPVTVQRRPTAIALNAISATALDLFKTTATLTDPNNGTLQVSSRTVTFTFSWAGTPSTSAVTNAVGLATAAYTAPAAAGSYILTASIPNDATYASTQTTTAFPVYKRNGYIVGVFVSTRVLDTFTVSATFYDSVSLAPVPGRTVKFSLQNVVSTQSAVTSAFGTASTSFTAPAASGTYAIAIWTEGATDATYNDTTVYMSSVTLARRGSYINLAGPANIIINSTFTPSGTMYDSVSLGTVGSRTLSFLFQASTNTALTSGLGVAATGYTASPSSGTYGLQVSFAGDATYNPSFSSKTVTAMRYPTSLSGPAITVTMNEVLTATATLRDYLSATVPSKPLVFYFTNSSFTWVTSGSGVAYSTYAASVASGTYSLPVSFAGDALYESTAASLSLLVNKRVPLLAPAAVVVKALDIFTATATLSDALYPAQKVAGETVLFQFLVGPSTFYNSGVTGADGVATSTFMAPASTGTYQFRATFTGSATYYPLAAYGPVTAAARPVLLMQDNSAGVIDEPFLSTATLVDQALGYLIGSRTILFTYGSSSAAVTGGNGKASAGFTAPASSGSYRLDSSFAGDATYAANTSSGVLTVSRRPAAMSAPDIAGIIDEVFTSTLTLSDALNAGKVYGSTVSFVFSGKTFNAATSVSGVAVSTFAAPPASGTYYASITYPGSARYLPNGTTVQLLVDRRPTGLTPDAVTTRADEIFSATATLKDALSPGTKPSGQPLVFFFKGSSFTVLTDADGIAVSTFSAPPSSGTARLDVSFAGDPRYQPSVSSTTVFILRRPSAITIEPAAIQALDVLTATATLTDGNNPSVYAPGRNLIFSFRNSSFTSLTDAGGIAVSTYAGPASSGTYVIEAAFEGDAIFDSSYSSGTVTVTQRKAGITLAGGSAYPFETYLASGSIRDQATGIPVAGRLLSYTLNGIGADAFTSGAGVATAPYTTPEAFGDYELSAAFAGDGTYAVSAGSATVAVMQRPTRMTPADTSVIAMEVFIASATLYDVRLASAVAGKEAVFIFEGETSTAATDATGMASVTFSAPVSSGVYYYETQFHGDMIYAVSSSTGAVSVGTRATRVIARDTNANVGEPFILTAQLLDPARETLPGYLVAGVPMEFKFKNRDGVVIETVGGITNSLGIATAAFSSPGAPDVYYYTAKFEGDYTYTASSATALVKVGLLTSLVAFDIETVALESFTGKAKLTDYLSTTLDDKLIRFKFISDSNSSVTNADGVSGIASSTFTAPASSGTYYYTAYFDGDSIYSPSNTTATVKVTLRPSTIITPAAATLAYSSFTASVSLLNLLAPNAPIIGRDVDIVFEGSTITVNTAADGTAGATFFAPHSSGTYNFHAYFYGDDTYSPTEKIGTVTVSLRHTTMLSYNVSDLLASSTFTAKVQIKDDFNQPIPGLSVDFNFDGNFDVGSTNAQGIAEVVFTAPSSSGTYVYTAAFNGDLRYSSSTADGNVTIGARPTLVFTPAVSSRLGAPLNLSARLVDINNQTGIEGKTLYFYFEGSTLTAVTDGFGASSATFTAPASTGVFAYGAEFIGDELTYTSSYSSSPVTIALNMTSLEARSGIALKIYEPLSVEAVLRDYIGVPMTGLPVKFTFEGLETTSLTEGAGIGKATATFITTLLASTGTYNYTAEYTGDTVYVASVDTSNVVNISRRESLLMARDVQSTPSKAVVVEARFYDNVNGSALAGAVIPGKTVNFVLDLGTYTQTASGITSGSGVSTVTFSAPVSTGTFLLTATFANDDPVYIGAVSSAAFRVYMDDGTGAIKTKLKVENGSAYITQTFVASGTLTASDVPVPGKPVLFEFFNGIATYTAAGFTDDVGLATAAFTAPASSGTYFITGTFGGDMDYSAASGTSTLTANRYPDSLTARAATALSGEEFPAKAVLRDEFTLGFVAGKTIVFEFFNGVSTVTKTAVTSSTGSAETTFTSPSAAGDYTYTARFAGDTVYVGNMDVASVLIASKGSSTFLIGYDVFIGTGEVFAASATLTSKGLPVPGKAVTISFQGTLRISTTNAQGIAFSSFTAPSSSGTFSYQAEFFADPDYNAALATAPVSVVFRKLPEAPVVSVAVTSAAITLAWTPVPPKPGQVVTGYEVETAASLRPASWHTEGTVSSTAPSLGYTVQADPDAATYLKVKTKLDDDQESYTLRIVEVPSKAEDPARIPNYYFMSQEENNWSAWVKIPGKVMDKVSADPSFDIDIKKGNNPGFLASYLVTALGTSSTLEADLKTADKKGVKLTVAYPQSGTGTSAARGQLAIYWYNGVEWVKLGGEIDVLTGELYTYSRVLGQFAVKAAPLASEFALTKVAPRIFSPDEPDNNVNRARFYFENPDGGEVTIRIFDITGALVRRNLESEGANIMFWNGKDQSGALVRGGVYLYQMEATDKVITGTVVVAK